MHLARTALKTVVYTILPLLLLLGAGGFIWLGLQGKQLLSVQTGSMQPAIKPGDLVVVSPITPSNLKTGDIVTFIPIEEVPSSEPQTVTHRIIESPNPGNEYQYITKGDANQAPDLPLSADRIVGKVDFSLPFVGRIAQAISNPFWLVILVYLPALLVVIDEIQRLARHYQNRRNSYRLM